MSSDNDSSDASAGSHGDVHENSTDQDSVTSGSDGLVPSVGSHMGSVSVDSIDADSITDPLKDGFVDQTQQERGGGGLNLAVETEILGSEVGTEDPIINSGAIGEEGVLGTILKGRSVTHIIYNRILFIIRVILNSLTAIGGHDRPYFYKLRARVVSLRIFVRYQRLMARKIAELFGLNRGVRPFYAARCFDELSRGSFLCLLNASFKTAVSQRHNLIL
jgi:hypothetical protein